MTQKCINYCTYWLIFYYIQKRLSYSPVEKGIALKVASPGYVYVRKATNFVLSLFVLLLELYAMAFCFHITFILLWDYCKDQLCCANSFKYRIESKYMSFFCLPICYSHHPCSGFWFYQQKASCRNAECSSLYCQLSQSVFYYFYYLWMSFTVLWNYVHLFFSRSGI